MYRNNTIKVCREPFHFSVALFEEGSPVKSWWQYAVAAFSTINCDMSPGKVEVKEAKILSIQVCIDISSHKAQWQLML